VKCIGYDAGPKDSRRAHDLTDDGSYAYVYPLRDAGWDRERCVAEIQAAGVKLPRKSACVFCPAAKTYEIAALVRDYPELADYIVRMEGNADLTKIDGLWRGPVKGFRGAIARPGSMSEFIGALRAEKEQGRDDLMKYHLALAPAYEAGGCPL